MRAQAGLYAEHRVRLHRRPHHRLPSGEIVVKRETINNINKYLDLAREVVDMWKVDTAVIVPIVVTANGLIAKNLKQHLRRLLLGSWIKGLIQKAEFLYCLEVLLLGALTTR
ncbi:hypothetical protein PYW07_008898 [Mythimna separata]|uniref:Uncharacterized protein n=1 Tax=Mythimna separata TaxID=271217 RepID=A0AAD7YAJ9_MYTSE|nr:hypothetical protein PYW07_008898 [Mythimna separata]